MNPDKKEIETEIDKAIGESDDSSETPLTEFLEKLDLASLRQELLTQYRCVVDIRYPPLAMAKAIIYRQLKELTREEVAERIQENDELAESFGFDLSELPNENSFERFKRKRLTMKAGILIDHAVEHIRDEGAGIVQLTGEEEEPLEYLLDREAYTDGERNPGQDWGAYNAAQTTEKLHFKQLLSDLVATIQDTRPCSEGRTGYDVQTKVFALALKEYTGKSGRRVVSELEEAREQGLIEETPHFNSLYNFYGDTDLVGLLHKLITVTAKPLVEVEDDFTVDASGLGTDMYQCWHDTKFNDVGERREFRKLHVMSGVKTNVITSVQVTDGMSGDSPEFTKLLKETAEHFDIREVSADKAYLSRENLDAVTAAGGIPFIPFKSNSSRRASGSKTWSRMYRFFQRHRDEYMRHYHKRSNAETVFAMMKQKIGTKLANKNELSQFNEALVKCLVHNLLVLIQESYELNVEVDFGMCAEEVLA